MSLAALRGGLGFLTTLPVDQTKADWNAFVANPGVIPLVGYVVGAIAALPFLLPLPDPIVGFLFVFVLYLLTGINHVDGLLDVADGVGTHDGDESARQAMKDSSIGVGAVLSLGIVLLGLFALGQTLAGGSLPVSGPVGIVGLVVAAEVAAKLAMILVLARGTPTHDGLGHVLAEGTDGGTVAVGVFFALPVVVFTWPSKAPALALVMGSSTGLVAERWAAGRLGGISGDVVGATNEIARLVALGSGVIAWTLW